MMFMMMAIMLAACSEDEEETSREKSEVKDDLTGWVQPYTGDADAEKEMRKKITDSYTKKFPDVKVNIETIPWANRDQKILTALAANNGPDVFYAIPDQMPQYADAGMLLELDPYLKGYDMEDFVDTALESTQWKDKTYGLPILQEANTHFYNVDIIKAIGEDPNNLPETWEEYEAWAEKAKKAGFYAMSYLGGGSQNSMLYPFVWQAGGEIIDENDKIMINEDAGVKAFELINNFYQKGYFPKDSITAIEQDAVWESGKVMSVIGSGFTVTQLKANAPFEYVIAPPLKDKEQVTYGTTGMFVVPSNSDNKSAAAEFVKVITETENQRTFNTVTQYIPTREAAKDIFEGEDSLAQLATYTEFARPGVIHPVARNIMPGIQAQIQSMLSGEITPQEAADNSAASIEAELKK